MCASLKLDPQATCDTCGRYGAYRLDGETLCAECYELRGSCCPEFGADDLWTRHEAKPPADGSTPGPGPRSPAGR